MSTALPNELMDRVIDHFYNNAKALSSCGLVCSSWTPSVRYHRFHDVQLEKDALLGFLKLLRASPAVASYVRSMYIDYYCHAVGSGTAVLCDILSSLPKLSALSLCFMTVGSAQARDLFSALPKSLERIKMVQVIFSTLGDLIFLWSQLPRLRSFVAVPMLSFGGIDIPEEYMRRDKQLFHATEFQMAWFIPRFDAIVDWLCSQNIPAQLRACSACVAKPQDIVPVVRLLRAFGPTLEGFEFCMNAPGMEAIRASGALDNCDLAQCTGLEELHFAALLNGSANADIFLCISRFLAQVRAPGIRAVVFSFYGDVPCGRLGDKPATHLDSLAVALSRNGALEGLERVVVRLSEGLGRVEEPAYASIRSALQWVEDRGLILLTVELIEEDETKKWVY